MTHSVTDPSHHAAASGLPSRRTSATGRFIRHYLEMVTAMFLGMVVLGVPAGWVLAAAGSSWAGLTEDAPALMLLGMAATMTVPMVAWMRYRGHGWRPSGEMAASMLVPTFAAIGLLAGGVVDDVGALLAAEHVVMLAAMLAAMLLRVEEYAQHHHAGAGEEVIAS